MKTRNLIAIILILSFVISPSFKVHADIISEIEQNEKALLDVKVDSLISNIINTIDKYYVDPSLGKKIINGLKRNLKDGKYRSVKTIDEFANQMTADLRALSNDLHLYILVNDENQEGPRRMMRRRPGGGEMPKEGYYSSKILEGNIGYFKPNRVLIAGGSINKDMDEKMLKLKNTDALIIDMRNVPGGVPEGVQLLSSYLFGKEEVVLTTYVDRVNGNQVSKTRPTEVSFYYQNKPVYVLINSNTASGGESFTYTNQQHGRVTVVGEKSRGAGRLASRYPIHSKLSLSVSIRKSIHPKSGTGFEGIGVIPDKNIPSSESLHKAHIMSLNKLIKSGKNENELKDVLSSLKKKEGE